MDDEEKRQSESDTHVKRGTKPVLFLQLPCGDHWSHVMMMVVGAQPTMKTPLNIHAFHDTITESLG